MFIAEIKGKLSHNIEEKEDVLTSNVFSFFKYADRKAYLKPFLAELDIIINDEEAEKAEFIFWPKYDDRTEPDFVLITGHFYILFEAKLHSDFGQDQLMREAEGGQMEANNLDKEFYLVAITKHYSEPKDKFGKIVNRNNFKWVNWNFVTSFLEKKIKKDLPDELFAKDLQRLLIKKNLRVFEGFNNILQEANFKEIKIAFFDYFSAKHRGSFIGFLSAFIQWRNELEDIKIIFYGGKNG
jgi:hypothetical protein